MDLQSGSEKGKCHQYPFALVSKVEKPTPTTASGSAAAATPTDATQVGPENDDDKRLAEVSKMERNTAAEKRAEEEAEREAWNNVADLFDVKL